MQPPTLVPVDLLLPDHLLLCDRQNDGDQEGVVVQPLRRDVLLRRCDDDDEADDGETLMSHRHVLDRSWVRSRICGHRTASFAKARDVSGLLGAM